MEVPICLKSLFSFKNEIIERNSSKVKGLSLIIFPTILMLAAAGALFFLVGSDLFLGVCLLIFFCLCLGIGLYAFIRFLQLKSLDNKLIDFFKRELLHKERRDAYRSESRNPMSRDLIIKKENMNFFGLTGLDKVNLITYYFKRCRYKQLKLSGERKSIKEYWEYREYRANKKKFDGMVKNYLLTASEFGKSFFSELTQYLKKDDPQLEVWIGYLLDFLQYPFIYFLFRTKAYKKPEGSDSDYVSDDAVWIIPEERDNKFYTPDSEEYFIRTEYNSVCERALRFMENAKRYLSFDAYSLIKNYYCFDYGSDFLAERLKDDSFQDPNKFFFNYNLKGTPF